MQEATPSGAVASWRAYSASGALSAGSDAVLGSLADPVSLNRYLYCGADPVNFVGPTGHASLKMDRNAKKGAAAIGSTERLFTQVEFGMRLRSTGAMASVWGGIHTKIWELKRSFEIRQQYGKKGQRLFERRAAASYRKHVQRIYCGNADHLKDYASDMHAFARALDGAVIGGVPIVPDLIDWCAYMAECKVEMGGKVTDVLVRGNVTITFKHGDRHAIEMGLDPKAIEDAIADDIQRIGVQGIREMGNGAGVDLVVNGAKLKYKPYVLDDNNVNVGTYIFE